MTPSIPPLAGFSVAVTADRRAEEQVALLRRRGADVVLGPTVRTLPLVDSELLSSTIEDVIARPPDMTVLLTGIGTRGMFAAAEGIGRDDALVDVLNASHVIARGPKAAGAAMTARLDVGWQAPGERSSEILERLRDDAGRGARIAVQRDGQSVPGLAVALRALGAEAVDILVYRCELPEDTQPAERLIEAIVAGEVDAVTFTSSPAIRHLVSIARQRGVLEGLLDALATDVVATCVGPVCNETAIEVGICRVLTPKRARLGAMVQALSTAFEGRSTTVASRIANVVIQGRSVFVDGAPAAISARERSLLDVLVAADGAVVPKQRLLRDVWGPDFADEHAVEVAIARLRRGLGMAGSAVQTVARRGYRLAA